MAKPRFKNRLNLGLGMREFPVRRVLLGEITTTEDGTRATAKAFVEVRGEKFPLETQTNVVARRVPDTAKLRPFIGTTHEHTVVVYREDGDATKAEEHVRRRTPQAALKHEGTKFLNEHPHLIRGIRSEGI